MNSFTINLFTAVMVGNGYKGTARVFLFFFFSSFCLANCAQSYSVVGTYKDQSAQGMAIYEKYAFLFNNTGICRIYNIETKKVEREFNLESSGKNHCNSVSFGVEKKKGSKFPVIYISQCNAPYKCFVESITDTSSILVQTIYVNRLGINKIVHDWVVDRKNRALYSITDFSWKEKGVDYPHVITKYRLPKLSDGALIALTDEDVVESFGISFPNLLQGASIQGDYLYLPTGRNGVDNREDAKREVIIVNLRTRVLEDKINLMYITENEPEDCDFYKGNLLVYCGQEGGLYEVQINH